MLGLVVAFAGFCMITNGIGSRRYGLAWLGVAVIILGLILGAVMSLSSI